MSNELQGVKPQRESAVADAFYAKLCNHVSGVLDDPEGRELADEDVCACVFALRFYVRLYVGTYVRTSLFLVSVLPVDLRTYVRT